MIEPRPTPSDRLMLSRERLRHAIQSNSRVSGPDHGQDHGAQAAGLMAGLKLFPGSQALLDALRLWWSQQPVRAVAVVAEGLANEALTPFAKKHPWSLVVGGFVVGALIAWTRPWRWAIAPVLLTGLLPQIISAATTKGKPEPWSELIATLAQQWLKPK
jgi:hypothetical protein